MNSARYKNKKLEINGTEISGVKSLAFSPVLVEGARSSLVEISIVFYADIESLSIES